MLIAVLVPGFIWLQAAAGMELLLWLWTLPAFIFCTFPLRERQSDEEVLVQSQSSSDLVAPVSNDD